MGALPVDHLETEHTPQSQLAPDGTPGKFSPPLDNLSGKEKQLLKWGDGFQGDE